MLKQFPATLQEVQEWVKSYVTSVMSLDTETDGLHYGCKLKGISLCNGRSACYINLDNNPDFGKILDLVLKTICNVDLLIMHNASFDLRVLKQYGLELR